PYGGSAKGFTVQLTGFRPDLPYTITAAVVADTGLKKVPPGCRQPLRFSTGGSGPLRSASVPDPAYCRERGTARTLERWSTPTVSPERGRGSARRPSRGSPSRSR